MERREIAAGKGEGCAGMEPFVCRSDAGLGQDNGIRDNAALPVLQRRGGSGGAGVGRAGGC